MLLEVINDAPRRADQHINALLKHAALLFIVDAAKHDGKLQLRVFADAERVGVNLHGELARRSDHNRARRIARALRGGRLDQQSIEQGYQKGRGLAGTRLCLPGDIAPSQGLRQRLRLDRRAAYVA